MQKQTYIELLAPARNADFGRAAINHGADAIYIGASQFGARAAVGNSIDEIEKLVSYAHFYRAKVYTTLNTILYDNELNDAQTLINQLYNIGIDGLIIQDMGLLELNLPPIPLIASTQTHNASAEKVKFLEQVGFKRVILARELSLNEISNIRQHTQVELESFVHGAICVSYSGQCYMSQTVCGRSGNRGVCAQPCRSSYHLVDSSGETIIRNKHLLSPRDLNLSDHLEQLMDAGVTSFKIEGRLKDIDYLKNVTSWYRKATDKILEGKTGYTQSSSGKITHSFTPDLSKSFNRGFTSYFADGRNQKTGSFTTQKSMGKRMGEVSHLSKNWFILTGDELVNGDGICFFNDKNELTGTLIGRVEDERVYPNSMEGIRLGLEVYRNHDHRFEKQLLADNTASRKIEVDMCLSDSGAELLLELTDADGIRASAHISHPQAIAEKAEQAKIQTSNQLSKLGETSFVLKNISINTTNTWFLPSGLLNQLRRDAVKALEDQRAASYIPERIEFKPNSAPYFSKKLNYQANVSNELSQKFYQRHGVEHIDRAFELETEHQNKVVMTTRHCIRYQLDACPVHQKAGKRFNEPLYLKDNNHTFRLDFDCKSCLMFVVFIE